MLLVRSGCVSWGLQASSPENPNRRQSRIHLASAPEFGFAVLSNLPPDEQPTELLANTMRILDRMCLCGNQISGALRHRRDVVTHWLISTQA